MGGGCLIEISLYILFVYLLFRNINENGKFYFSRVGYIVTFHQLTAVSNGVVVQPHYVISGSNQHTAQHF